MGTQLDHDGPILSCTIAGYGNIPLRHAIAAAPTASLIVGLDLESQFSDAIARTALYPAPTVN